MSQSTVAVQRKVDEICNEFESEWVPTEVVDVNRLIEYWQLIEPRHRPTLLFDLIKVDVELRLKFGLLVNASDYSKLNSLEAIQYAESSIEKFSEKNNTSQGAESDTVRTISFQVSQKLGPYELIEQIGQGGMGVVWKAWQNQPVKRFLAIKVIGNVSAGDTLARFEAERQALALMDHPGIARLIDAGSTQSGQPYFAMELVNGVSITTFCDQNKLNIRQRLELFVDVCSAVSHAHQRGIIHRDLKPSNIMVSNSNDQDSGKAVAKVIDFGLVKALSDDLKLNRQTQHTRFDQVLGTYRYMSPEQARIGNKSEDVRCDIYSLGVILFELLAGSTPLESTSIEDQSAISILEKIRECESIRPSTRIKSSEDRQAIIAENRNTNVADLMRDLVGELDWIVLKSTFPEPERRYQSVHEFAADIDRFIVGEVVLARPPSRAFEIKKFVSRNRWQVTFAILAFFLLIAGIIGTTIGMLNAKANAAAAIIANEQSQKRLEQLVENNRVLSGIFYELDVFAPQGKRPLKTVLADRLAGAAASLANDTTLITRSQLEIQHRIANALIGLDQTPEAVKILKKTLALCRQKFGDLADITTSTSTDLAGAYLTLGKNKLAQSQFEWSISQQKKKGEIPIRALNGLSEVYRHENMPYKTIEIQKLILRHMRQANRPRDLLYLFALTQLANAQRAVGQFDEAEKNYQDALDYGRGWLREDDLNLLHVKSGLVYLLNRMERFEEAVIVSKEVLDGRIKILGEKSIKTALARESFVVPLLKTKQFDLASEQLVRAFVNTSIHFNRPKPFPFFQNEYFEVLQSIDFMSQHLELFGSLQKEIQNGTPNEVTIKNTTSKLADSLRSFDASK